MKSSAALNYLLANQMQITNTCKLTATDKSVARLLPLITIVWFLVKVNIKVIFEYYILWKIRLNE